MMSDLTADKIREYSINLMWINKTLNQEMQHIIPEQYFKMAMVSTIAWARANPQAEINFWFDSKYTTETALNNTTLYLDQICNAERCNNIRLKDIRQLPAVMTNPDSFSDQLPIYFRVDILKAIIIVDEIERGGKNSAIFTDLEVGDLRPLKDRMSKAELFNPETIDKFKKTGLILGSTGRIENQFLQLINDPAMIHSIKHMIINANLLRAVTALNLKVSAEKDPNLATAVKALASKTSRDIWGEFIPQLNEIVFSPSIKDALCYYQTLKDPEQQITIMNGSSNVKYELQTHGYEPFGLFSIKSMNGTGIYDSKTANFIARDDVMELPRTDVRTYTRKVDVRITKTHSTPREEIEYKPPADGLEYQCAFLSDEYHLSASADRRTKPKA